MRKIKKWITKQIKKMMLKLKNWIIKKIKKAFESFNGFIAKQTWIITLFALIGGGYVLYLSGSVFVPYVGQMLDEKFTKVIIIENPTIREAHAEEGETIETIIEDVTEEVIPETSLIEEISKIFPEEPETAIAIFKAESGLSLNAKGWNCRYSINGTVVSKACNPEDRQNAWSVDCGIAQINIPGKECSKELLGLDKNLELAREKYQQRGWHPWTAYKNNSYKKFL